SATPALLLMTVRWPVPRRASALMRFSGMPHNPKPPSRMLAPSGTSATAAAAVRICGGMPDSSRAAAHPPGTHLGLHVVDGFLRRRTGPEESPRSELLERFHVFLGDDAAAGHEDIGGALLGQQRQDAREVRHV